MNAQNEANQDVIVFDNLCRPSGGIVDGGLPVEARAINKAAEPFVCANASGCTRVFDSLNEIGDVAGVSGQKFKATFGK